MGFKATLDKFGNLLVNGVPWNDPIVLNAVRKVAGKESRLVWDEREHRLGVLPLLVATDGAIAQFGRDGRRLRPNLVIGGVSGLAEGELFLAAIGGCFMSNLLGAITARKMEIRDVWTRITGTLAKAPPHFAAVGVLVGAHGPADQLERLVEIADRGAS